MDSPDFVLHARLLGGSVTREFDLLPSALIGVVFCLLVGALGYRWWSQERGRRPVFLLVLAVGFFSTGLGFIIRAADSNTAAINRKVSTVIAEQILLFLGHCALIDSAILLNRDLLLVTSNEHPFSKQILFAIIARVFLVIAIILSSLGFADIQSTSQTNGSPRAKKTNLLRLFGALIPFLIVIINLFLFCLGGILLHKPYLRGTGGGLRTMHRSALIATAVVLIMNIFMLVPSLYNFVIVAVANDTNPLVSSKLFFYLAYGLFQGIVGCILAGLDIQEYFLYAPYLMFSRPR